MSIEVETLFSGATIPVPKEYAATSTLLSEGEYRRLYDQSIEDPDAFWRQAAQELHWHQPFTQVLHWDLPQARWFEDGRLNISYNCLDRHIRDRGDKRALIFVGEGGDRQEYTYRQLLDEVSKVAAGLSKHGVTQGDRVAIYLPLIAEAVIAMLACTRIGAIHSVVFAGFSADSLRHRIEDAGATWLITANGCQRRGRLLDLGAIADEAVAGLSRPLKGVISVKRTHNPGPRCRTLEWTDVRTRGAQGMEAVALPAEHPSFILYTSGTTGKPKGIQHSTGGYLLGAQLTMRYVFDLRPDDVFWCTADVGWITGHSYTVYGALANGCTTLIYEGAPNAPDWGRFWQIVEQEKVTIFYTAPTAIRAFMKAGNEWPEKYDLSSLRLLGSVGEPINPAAWDWYFRTIGKERCPIVDTWWQTETGSICLTTMPGIHAMKPGASGLPFFGIAPKICEEDGSEVPAGKGGFLAITRPWPAMARTIWGDDQRYGEQYWSLIPGCYATGDGAICDKDGYFWVMGRVDDVMNVSGHRIGTMEVESALVAHPSVAEAAVVGRSDDMKGQAPACFVIVSGNNVPPHDVLIAELRSRVEKDIGKFARPDDIYIIPALPKTRSGKIMRRVLRSIAESRDMGDITTLEDPDAVANVQEAVRRSQH